MVAGKRKGPDVSATDDGIRDFTDDLIKSLNKELGDGEKIAYNLEVDDAPTKVNRWISTGIKQLDYIIANRRGGGLPEGRIIEIFGPPGIGKSHIAAQIAKQTQKMGGLVVYIDSETATSVENLKMLGVEIGKNFIYIKAECTEKVFEVAEMTIMKTRSLKRDIPVTVIWDSVAATAPKAEILGDYDKDSIGLQARALSKGFRKITQEIGNNKVTFVCLNQTRTAIGVMYGDNQIPSGGKAIPFHSSVRIKLGAGSPILNAAKEAIGINVSAKIIKNRLSPPFRSCEFQIHFGVGIKEHEQLFDVLRVGGPAVVNGKRIEVEGTGGWKTLTVREAVGTDPKDASGELIIEKKFTKKEFHEIIEDPTMGPYIDDLMEAHFTRKMSDLEAVDVDDDSYVEISAIAQSVQEIQGDSDPEAA